MDSWETDQIVKNAAWDEEDIKDSWDADEEQPQETKTVAAAQPAKKTVAPAAAKTNTKAKTAGKGAKADDVEEEESELDRKQRLERLVRQSDLESAMSLFGISKNDIDPDAILSATKATAEKSSKAAKAAPSGAFETAQPATIGEFDQFATLICKKVASFESHKLYYQFLENLIKGLASTRDTAEVRKLASVLSEVAAQKQRERLTTINKKKPAPDLGLSKKANKVDYNDYGDAFDEDDDY